MNEVQGRTVILVSVGLAVSLGLAGAWYRISTTNDCVRFWTPAGARLIAGETEVELLDLSPASSDQNLGAAESAELAAEVPAREMRVREMRALGSTVLAGEVVGARVLTGRKGMTHFRKAMTQDHFFDWAQQERVSWSESRDRWRQAFLFYADGRGDAASLTVVVDEGYKHWGRVDEEAAEVVFTAAVHLDEMTRDYLALLEREDRMLEELEEKRLAEEAAEQ